MSFDFQSVLNEAQWEAVAYCDGPSLVIAGAGSGKTRVLTYKIAYLISQGMMPWQILALTFTNKAAREMNDRIASVVGAEAARQVWSGTFHSIFARILRMESAYTGYPSDFSIYDASDSLSLVKSLIKEQGLDDKVYKPRHIASLISEAKNALILPAQYQSDPAIAQRDRIANVAMAGKLYELYNQRLKAANAMDFDDLLLQAWLLFEQHPDVTARYRERFRYILIDEYQDTNAVQHQIVRQLAATDARVCVVGDDAQSIYSFRGARIDNILGFQSQYPSTRLIKLERNYRSTQTIVNAANSLIRHNKSQIPKEVYSQQEQGERLKVFQTYSEKDESAKIAGEVHRLHGWESIPYDDIALLYRTNAQSRSFEETFRTMGIPYRIYGGLSFYQRKEVKDLIAYFRLVCNPHDEEAFKRIINYPARGIGQTTLGKIQTAATASGLSLWQVCSAPDDFGLALNKGTKAKLQDFVALMVSFRERLHSDSGSVLATEIIRRSGIRAELQADLSPEGISRLENVGELLNAIKANEAEVYEETGNDRVLLTDYLAQVALLTDADEKEDTTPRVSLMTIHAAKGLEFDTVFVTGLEEDLFPNANAKLYPREMEEERRLFYVAITRAKKRCYLTYATSRFRFGTKWSGDVSPFICEIDARFLDQSQGQPSGRFSQPPSASGFSSRPSFFSSKPSVPQPPKPTMQRVAPAPAGPSLQSNGTLSVGMRVAHERFGKGTIEALEGTGDSAKARVNFDNAGCKNLLLKFARLTVIG